MRLYSRPNGFPHNSNIDEKGLIKCDSYCPRYNADGFCRHVIAVSLQTKSLEKCACVLSRSEESIAIAIVSQKIDIKNVGHKSVARSRKKQIGSPEKEVRVSSQNNVLLIRMKAYQQAVELRKESKNCLHQWRRFRMNLLEGSSQVC